MSMVKGKKILFWDTGDLVDHAVKLGQDGAHVYYFTPYAKAEPNFTDYAPGLGYEKEGVEKVLNFFDYVDKADMVMFPYTGQGDLCTYLKRVTGKPVFGAGAEGEHIERDRWFARKLQSSLGLPIQKTVRILGIKNLRSYLKEHPDEHVKINIFRGDVESFNSKTFELIELYLNDLEAKFGPFADTYEFIVEEDIEGLEMGWDLYFNGNDWLKPYLWGSSGSTYSYIGKYSNSMPKPLQLLADKLKPILQKIDYRGAMSVEAIITKEGKPYLLDVCARYPIPMSNLYIESMENYSDVIWAVANKEDITIKPASKYVSCLTLGSKYGKKGWVEVVYKDKKNIKTVFSSRVKDKTYSIMGNETLCTVLGFGKTEDETIKNTLENMEKVNAFEMDDASTIDFDKIKEKLDKTKEYELGLF